MSKTLDNYFIYGGRIYARPGGSSGGLSLLKPFANWFGGLSKDNRLLSVVVATAGVFGLLMVINELVPDLKRRLQYQEGIPKLVLGKDSDRGASEVEGKGQEEKLDKAALAGKLKNLSASLSAERAQSKAVAAPVVVQSQQELIGGGKLRQKCQQLVVLIENNLVQHSSLQYCRDVCSVLQKISQTVQTILSENQGKSVVVISSTHIAKLLGLGRELGTSVNIVYDRSPLPSSVMHDLLSVQRTILSMHEASLEAYSVPSIANHVQQALTGQPRFQEVLKMVDAVIKLPPEQMLHRLVSVSIKLNSLVQAEDDEEDIENENIQAARAYLGRLAGIADELVATKLLKQVIDSLEEMHSLCEGKVMNKLVMRTRKACMSLWPELRQQDEEGAEVDRPTAESTPYGRLLLKTHVLIRKEQYRRLVLGQGPRKRSMHDVALWKHLVNACDEFSNMAFSNPGQLQFGSSAEKFIGNMNELIMFISTRDEITIEAREDMSYDNLIMESDFAYRKTNLTDAKSVQVLKKLSSEASSATPIMKAIHARVARLVEGILPGSNAGISISSSNGGAVTCSCGSPETSDAIVSFIVGVGDSSCKMLTFVSTSISASSQSALFDALQSLSFGDALEAANAQVQMTKEQKALMDQHDIVLKSLENKPYSSVAALPASLGQVLRETLQGQGFDKTKLLSNLRFPEKYSTTLGDPSIIIDPLKLRLDMQPGSRFMRFFQGQGGNILCFLLPDIVIVFTETSPAVSDMLADFISTKST